MNDPMETVAEFVKLLPPFVLTVSVMSWMLPPVAKLDAKVAQL
jgi:hypothetical protein